MQCSFKFFDRMPQNKFRNNAIAEILGWNNIIKFNSINNNHLTAECKYVFTATIWITCTHVPVKIKMMLPQTYEVRVGYWNVTVDVLHKNWIRKY